MTKPTLLSRFAITLLLALFALPAFASDEQIVQEISASGVRNLRPFTVKDQWEIRWDNKGSMITIAVRHPDGKLAADGGTQAKPGKGASYQPKGGTYFLEVSGSGDWTVTVVQLTAK